MTQYYIIILGHIMAYIIHGSVHWQTLITDSQQTCFYTIFMFSFINYA